jgi:hypothetical protein
MEDEMKGFWKFFILLMVGAGINLAGGILGKTLVGYLLFAVGLAIVVVLFAYLFKKTSYFKGGRLKVLILGLILSALLASSVILILNSGGAAFGAASNRNTLLSQFTGGAAQGGAGFSQFRQNGGTGNGGFSGGFAGGNTTARSSTGTTGSGTVTSGTPGTTGTTGTTGSTSAFAAAARSSASRFLLLRILGYVFLVAGVITLLVVVIRLLRKKTSYTGSRFKVLLLGLLIGAMLAGSTALLVSRTTRRTAANFNRAQFTQTGQRTTTGTQGSQTSGTAQVPSQNGTFVAATPAVTETPTPERTLNPTDIAATETALVPLPSNTPTAVVVSEVVVCLDYNRQVGESIRVAPNDTANWAGSIPAAACFTIDGRASAFPGWYHLAKGQNGLGGIIISTDETTHQLWVNGQHFMSTSVDLNSLPDITVTQ